MGHTSFSSFQHHTPGTPRKALEMRFRTWSIRTHQLGIGAFFVSNALCSFSYLPLSKRIDGSYIGTGVSSSSVKSIMLFVTMRLYSEANMNKYRSPKRHFIPSTAPFSWWKTFTNLKFPSDGAEIRKLYISLLKEDILSNPIVPSAPCSSCSTPRILSAMTIISRLQSQLC